MKIRITSCSKAGFHREHVHLRYTCILFKVFTRNAKISLKLICSLLTLKLRLLSEFAI